MPFEQFDRSRLKLLPLCERVHRRFERDGKPDEQPNTAMTPSAFWRSACALRAKRAPAC